MTSVGNDVAERHARELADREREKARKALRAQQASMAASIGRVKALLP